MCCKSILMRLFVAAQKSMLLTMLLLIGFAGASKASESNPAADNPTKVSQKIDYQMKNNDLQAGFTGGMLHPTIFEAKGFVSYGYNLTHWLKLETRLETGLGANLHMGLQDDEDKSGDNLGLNLGFNVCFRPFSWPSAQKPWLHSIVLGIGTTMAFIVENKAVWGGVIDLSFGYEFRTQSGFLFTITGYLTPLIYSETGIGPVIMGFGGVIGVGYSF